MRYSPIDISFFMLSNWCALGCYSNWCLLPFSFAIEKKREENLFSVNESPFFTLHLFYRKEYYHTDHLILFHNRCRHQLSNSIPMASWLGGVCMRICMDIYRKSRNYALTLTFPSAIELFWIFSCHTQHSDGPLFRWPIFWRGIDVVSDVAALFLYAIQ